MKPFNNSMATNKLRQETSVTGPGQAPMPSLHATKKKQNPFAEDELSGYKKLKGFRAGHTKDTGGFQYKDLWDVNEEYETDERLKVTLKGDVNYNKIGNVVDITKDGKYYTLQFKNGKTAIYHQSDVTKPAAQKSFEDKPELKIDEELNENYHRFKKETVTRSKEQQMHEAMKLVRKKLYEAEKVMDYVKTMKEELGLQEYKSHTNRLMEKLQVSIAEIYKKYKEIK